MTQLPSGTMVNLGGESKQELFDGGLVWCDERAMWARKTRTARLRRLHTCEVTNNGRDDGTNLAVRETVRDGCMRWKGKPVDVWKLAASAKQTDAKDARAGNVLGEKGRSSVMEVAVMVTSG
ncbi:hypothetical protein PC128_g5775 [Phytophthora cactorum]|nr:hypothetical protein PC128_g5775 [Phytophthora cactorum]